MRNGLRLCLVAAGLVAALAPASASAGVPLGQLGLVYEGTTTTLAKAPGRDQQSSYYNCGGNSLPGVRFLSGGGWLEGNNFGEAHFASLYPIDEYDRDRLDAIREVFDNTSTNTGITMGEGTVCGDLKPSYERKAKPSKGRKRTTAKVSCDAGEHVIGGGGKTSGKFKSQRLVSTAPFDGGDANEDPDDGWKIAVDNTRRKAGKITAFATCADLKHLSYVVDEFSLSTASNDDASASCPGGQYVVGGGLTQNGPFKQEKLTASRFSDDHGAWEIALDNLAGDPVEGQVFAICHA